MKYFAFNASGHGLENVFIHEHETENKIYDFISLSLYKDYGILSNKVANDNSPLIDVLFVFEITEYCEFWEAYEVNTYVGTLNDMKNFIKEYEVTNKPKVIGIIKAFE